MKFNSSKLQIKTESVQDVNAEGWVMSSESCGFLSIGARYVREVRKSSIILLRIIFLSRMLVL